MTFSLQSLQGSDDKDSVKIHWLQRFFDGRYIRLYPLSWYGDHICMRVELYGCIPGRNVKSAHDLFGVIFMTTGILNLRSLLPKVKY